METNIQSETVRKYVLEHLENGSFSSGMRLPGFRKIAGELNISGPIVQKALDTLVNEGILRAAPRSGLYVEPEWQRRPIRGSLRVFPTRHPILWLEKFRSEMERTQPRLHVSTRFQECPLEITTTVFAQSRHAEFIDLMPVVKECFPDLRPFYAEQLRPFTSGGRLTALPFVFSPRLLALNAKMLREAGCAVPGPDWTIADLSKLIARLRKKFPRERILSRRTVWFFWINFLLSCGGSLFDPKDPLAIAFDSPEALEGFRIARELCLPAGAEEIPLTESAIMIIDRQTRCRIRKDMRGEWLYLPIPGSTPERTGISMQATELFAVRSTNLDRDLIAPIVRFLWSEEFQDHLAALGYGIPIRRSSAARSFAAGTSPDLLFWKYCPQIRSDYQIPDPDLMLFICNGVEQILSGPGSLEKEIGDLAFAIRKYVQYRYERGEMR